MQLSYDTVNDTHMRPDLRQQPAKQYTIHNVAHPLPAVAHRNAFAVVSFCLHSRFLHPTRSCHLASPADAPATMNSSSSSSSSPPSTNSSPSITISPAQSGDWEARYNELKVQRQAAAITRWEELQSEYPDIDFPSPDGTERPSKRVVAVANKLFTLTLLESFQLARLMDDTYGFSAMAAAQTNTQPTSPQPTTSTPAAGAAAGEKKEEAKAAEAKTSFSVRLDGFGAADKIKVIKEVRTATGLGLKESKELVESAPKTIKKELNKADCDALVAKLKEAGAKVTVE